MSLLVLFSLASLCTSDASACTNAIADGGDDRCELLQSGVGLTSAHAQAPKEELNGPPSDWVAPIAADPLHVGSATGSSIGDLMKKVSDKVGGGADFEDDLNKIKEEADNFKEEVTTSMSLFSGAKDNLNEQVASAYDRIYPAAEKLAAAVKKALDDFMGGVGATMPGSLKDELSKHLDLVKESTRNFADSFKNAATYVRSSKAQGSATLESLSSMCTTVQNGITEIREQVNATVLAATGLTYEGISKEFQQAKEVLPASIKVEVEQILQKANEAAEHLKKLSEPAQEVVSRVVAAFRESCPGLKAAAGRLQLSLLTTSVLLALGWFM